jgi:hypothetical protein
MGIANRLQHPGWEGSVFPLLLAIGSTFSPSILRPILLSIAFLAATWTFYHTDYAGRKRRGTIPAAAVFLLIAVILFFAGRAFDSHSTEAKTPTRPPATSPSVQQQQNAPNVQQTNQGGGNVQQNSSGDNSPNVNPTSQGPGSISQVGGTRNQATVNNNIYESPPPPVVIVPQLSISTRLGLTLSDFSDLTVSPEMMKTLRRHGLAVSNPNRVELQNLVVRFQLPEPVIGNLVVEDKPAGVDIAWNACRLSMTLVGKDGVSAAPAPDGIEITASKPGVAAGLGFGREVCSPDMNNRHLEPTGIYQLKIERIPAMASITVGFLTSDDPAAINGIVDGSDKDPNVLNYFGEGTYQYLSNGQTETRTIFVPLLFDAGSRAISSLPSSGERGKWKISITHAS